MSKEGCNIKVISRFRPFIDIEIEVGDCKQDLYSFPNSSTVSVSKSYDSPEVFSFDHTFAPSTSQVEIFECVGMPIIEDILAGYNGTVFAYGQTGSGKSYTMMGSNLFDESSRGLIPRSITLIFDTLAQKSNNIEFTVKCSMLEIYKENLHDLLRKGSKLRIKESPVKGVFVEGLSEVYVVCEEELLNVLAIGEKNRSIACTKMNQQSSRSHQIFMIEVAQKFLNDESRKGVLNLVDLAGSEKISQTRVKGENLEEAKKINLSLSALGNVIHALTTRSDHIPYRDSKLTRLLQESLGGNYKTSLIVNCSPHPRNTEDTLNTLKFAQRAKTIKNNVKINITHSIEYYIKTIEELTAKLLKSDQELRSLRESVRDGQKSPSKASSPKKIINPEPEIKKNNNEELLMQIEQLTQQVGLLKSECEEMKEQNKDFTKKISAEKLKTIAAEEKYMELYKNLQDVQYIEKEKENALARAVKENKSYVTQIDYLKKVLENYSTKFTNYVKSIKSESLSLINFSQPDFESINSDLVKIGEKRSSKYFPETVKVVDFFTLNSFETLPDSDLKQKLFESGMLNIELDRKYMDLLWKYNILYENYSCLFGNIDFYKKTITNLKKSIIFIQSSYSSIITKLNKFIQGVRETVQTNFRRPVRGAVPCLYDDKKEPVNFVRRASFFHTIAYGIESRAPEFPVNENLLHVENAQQRTLENNLNTQILLNNQLKISLNNAKSENQKLKTLLENVSQEKLKYSGEMCNKIDIFLADISLMLAKKTDSTKPVPKDKPPITGKAKIFRGGSCDFPPKSETIVHSNRDSSLDARVFDVSSPNKRTIKKSPTMPYKYMPTKSSLTSNFLKKQPQVHEKKAGDS